MAITCNWSDKMGTVECGEYKYDIFTGGNCPFIMTHGKARNLVSFMADKKHLVNMLKDDCYNGFDKWRLNTFYKDTMSIAKELTKFGFTVTLYYEKPKQG